MSRNPIFVPAGSTTRLRYQPFDRQWFKIATQDQVNENIDQSVANNPKTYDDGKTYQTCSGSNNPDCMAIDDDGKLYRSIVSNNTGNKPSTSPIQWELVPDVDAPIKAGLVLRKTRDCESPSNEIDEYSLSAWAFGHTIDDCTHEGVLDFNFKVLIYFPKGGSAGVGELVSAFYNEQISEWENSDPPPAGCMLWVKAKHDYYRVELGISWVVADVLAGAGGAVTGRTLAIKIPQVDNMEPNVWFGREFISQCDNDNQMPPTDLCGNFTGSEELGFVAMDVQDQPLLSVRLKSGNAGSGQGWSSFSGDCERGSGVRIDDPSDDLEGIVTDVVYIGNGDPFTPQFGRKKMCLNQDEFRHTHGLNLEFNEPIVYSNCINFEQIFSDIFQALFDLGEDLGDPPLPEELFEVKNVYGLTTCKTDEMNIAQFPSGDPTVSFLDSPCLGIGINSDNYEEETGTPYSSETDLHWCIDADADDCNDGQVPGLGACSNLTPPTVPFGLNNCGLATQGAKSIQPRTQLFLMEERVNNSCNFEATTGDTTSWANPSAPNGEAPDSGPPIDVIQGQSVTFSVQVADANIQNQFFTFELDPVTAGDTVDLGPGVVRFTAGGVFLGSATLTFTIMGDNGCVLTHIIDIEVIEPPP